MGIEESNEIGPEDLLHDDPNLLADRLLRSLHKNSDGHLATARNTHKDSISDEHNVGILYVYTLDEGLYTLHHHYVHSEEARNYRQWNQLAIEEARRISKHSKSIHGVYGWLTSYLQITPLRTGDIFIKIDKDGATGVRLAFNPRKAKRETRKKTKRVA